MSWSEADFQTAVLDLAHMLGWKHLHVRRSIGKGRKWVTATNVPWADLTLWHPARGGFMVRELKASEKAEWQPGQFEVLFDLRQAGVDADWWHPGDLESGRIQRELTANRSVGALLKETKK